MTSPVLFRKVAVIWHSTAWAYSQSIMYLSSPLVFSCIHFHAGIHFRVEVGEAASAIWLVGAGAFI